MHDFSPNYSGDWLGKLKLEDGSVLQPDQIKTRLFDVMLDSIILSFAALGGYEFLLSNGKVIGIRLTPLGKWLVDQKNAFPDLGKKFKKEDDFEVDDSLMLIRVKNQSSPFLSILKEFSDPVMSNRYHLSDTKLLKGCKSKEDIENRINQLKEYVLGEPGPRIAQHFNQLISRINCVVPSHDGTTYRLFDVKSADRNLLRIITEDNDIVDNTLRVEGSRLLIKSSFVPDFIEKLRAAGYPILL